METPPRPGPGPGNGPITPTGPLTPSGPGTPTDPLTPTEPIARVQTGTSDSTVVNAAPPEPPGDGRPPRMPRYMLALMAAVISLALFWWFSQTQQAEQLSVNATVTTVNQATATAEA